MENLQKSVGAMGIGVAGDVAKGLHSYFLELHGVAKDDSVVAGGFVQSSDTDELVIGASGVSITGKILGIAGRRFVSGLDNSAIYPKNETIPYIVRGAVFIETETPAKKGQYVFLKTADGALAFGDTQELADHTFTGWQVIVGTGDKVNTLGHDIIVVMA